MSVFLQHNLSPCLHLHELKTFFPNESRGQTLKISDLIARDKKRAYFSCKRKDRRQYRSIENTVCTWMQRLIGKFCFIRQCKVFNLGRGKSQKESEPP